MDNSSYIQWFGNVPNDWEVSRNKQFLTECKEIVGDDSDKYQLLSLTKQGVIVRDLENKKGKMPKDFFKYKKVEKGDIIFCLFDIDETPRTVGLAENDGMITGAYDVFKINGINPKYLYYFYLNIDNHKGLKPFYTGLRKTVKLETFLALSLPLPPLSVQSRISSYLDEKTELINRLIDTRTAQIEKLKQYRAAVVSKAVTKGFNPNKKMKNSNIQWIGDIPEDWEVKRIKDVAFLQSGDNLTSADIESEGLYPVYGGNGLRGYYDKYNVEGFHVLIGRQGALCGNINYGEGKFWATDHAVVCYQNERIDTKWFGQLLTAMNLNQYSTASAQPGLSVDKIKMLQIPLPSLSEQLKIASYLDAKVSEINKLIKVYEDEIENVKKYKNSLISAVVTGQIAV